MKTIIIADNQYLTNSGWHTIFSDLDKSAVLVDAKNKKELLHQLINTDNVFAVVLDYTLFDFERIEELLILEQRFKNINWLLASEELSLSFLNTIVQTTHAFSILLKDGTKEETNLAVLNMLQNKRYICSNVSNLLFEYRSEHKEEKEVLTTTEKEILKDIAHGFTTKDIASRRNISTHTVVTHRKNIFRKISVNTIFEATKYAMRSGLVDMADYTI